jgi:DNA (cytosine-5)-methyltransferase 1
MVLTHGSLFAGIGGMDLGLEWAGFETSWQVEINPFSNKILEKRWPNVQRFLDVKDVGKHNLKSVDLISGGFPCQDLSVAAGGKERGLLTRSGLWFEYARILRELQPRWCIVENVPNLKTKGADRVISDLEETGYSCWASVVGAEAFGAPFQRERVFILAHHNSHGTKRLGEDVSSGWTLSPELERKVAQACQNWNYWKHELGTGNARSSGEAEESESDSYARGIGTVYGVPDWSHRLKALGNACTPVIPAILGSFIQNYEALQCESNTTTLTAVS